MKTAEKIKAAIEIFRATLPEAHGKFRPLLSGSNGNVVEFFTADGLYCSVNVRSGAVRI